MQAPLLDSHSTSPAKERVIPASNGHANGHADGHAHAHEHGGGGDGLSEEIQKKLKRAICLSVFFMFVEIFGGIMAHSLAIITDAAHIMSDVSGFAVSLFAVVLATKKATTTYTYGYRQAEILGALFSVMIVWFMTGVLLWEAVQRFIEVEAVDGKLMCVMATIGLMVNFALIAALGHNHSHAGGSSHSHAPHAHGDDLEEGHAAPKSSSLALDAAVVHVIGDIVQSAGVLLAAILIWWQPFDLGETNGISNWNYADPMCTVLFSILVMFTTVNTVRQSLSILMQRAPDHIDVDKLQSKLRSLDNVQCVHDVHVWNLGSNDAICTAHVVVSGCSNCGSVLAGATKLANSMGISHTTFQLEAHEEDADVKQLQADCCHNNSCSTGDYTCSVPKPGQPGTPVVIVSQATPLARAPEVHAHSHNHGSHGHSH